mmetsp:Transcript_19066/g.8871  ORF Transcript_19066/g.8871 Transcript_19066/m.8871 type:complete len:99 (+) Transcript_19066:713-1009(+)
MRGDGKYKFAGGVYIGEFYDNQKNGKGSIHFDNGDIFEGNFVKGAVNAEAENTLTFKNGDVYKGKFAHMKPEGFGKYYYKGKDNIVYKGYFVKGVKKT